ncbi:MAG: DUF2070 domain-containing protein, partial [Vulcanisaeta sp.]
MRSRSFEHGYTMVFRGGGPTKYLLLAMIIIIPYLMTLYTRETVLTYVKSLVVYGLVFLTVLISLRAVISTYPYRGFGVSTSLFNTTLVVFIDLLITLAVHKFIVGFGALSSVLPLSAMMMALRGLEHNGKTLRKYIVYPIYTLP